jgi:hypothetical protein
MSRLEHPVFPEELMAYHDGQLEKSRESEVAKHVEGCPECAAVLTDTKQVSMEMASWNVEEAPYSMIKQVLAELKDHSASAVQSEARASFWFRHRLWVYGLGGAFALVLIVFSVTPPLLRSRRAVTMPQQLPQPPQGQQGQPRATGPYGRQPILPSVVSGPMVIRNIRVSLITKEFDAARSRIDAVVLQVRGYVDRLEFRADPGSARRLSATVRLPSAQADSGLAELKTVGQLMEESQSSSDITAEYVDLAARLSNAQNSEQRLLGLLRDRAGDLQAVIAMEREIASVREQIERMQAQQKNLANKVEFVTVQIEVREEYRAQLETPAPAPSRGTQFRNATVDGIQAAVENVAGIILFALRYGPVVLIWFAFLGSVGCLVWRFHLRMS